MALGEEYKFNKLRFAAPVFLGRLLVGLLFALGGMSALLRLFMRLIGGGAVAAMIEGERKGSLDNGVPLSAEGSRIKRGMWMATLALDVTIAAAIFVILIAAGEMAAVAARMSPAFIGSLAICYAAIAVVMPVSYYAWAKKPAPALGLK